MNIKTTLTVIALLLSATSVNAEFVHTDWKVEGDSRSTLHEETGIEWLKLDNTLGKSINEVQSLLSTTYAGWRLPTNEEVNYAAEHHFRMPLTRYQRNVSSARTAVDDATSWSEFMGITERPSRYIYTRGYYMSQNGGLSVNISYVYDITTNMSLYHDLPNGSNLGVKAANHGVFLVSDGGTTRSSQLDPSINANNANAPVNDVSSPMVAGGMVALLGMGLARRRKLKITH